MTIQLKSQHELQLQISDLYKKDEKAEIILKTSMALEMVLTLGLDTQKATFKMIDLGVKPDELGLSMAIALKRTEDKFLSATDLEIKRIVLSEHGTMIKELEGFL